MKQSKVSRRDALKFFGTLGIFSAASKLLRPITHASQSQNISKPNFIVIVFDTLSARHMSLYGYERKTTPNIEKFAKTSTVFHRNYASSNFTQSSTASLFTGVYPWSHRSLDFFSLPLDAYIKANIFNKLPSSHKALAYTHNIHVLNLLEQYKADIDMLKPIEDLVVYNANKFPNSFKNDNLMGFYATKRWRESFYAPSYSLFMQPTFTFAQTISSMNVNKKYKSEYPLGLGDRDGYLFKLEDAMDWIGQVAESTSEPFLGYFHLLPPHEVYRPRAEFLGMFAKDNFKLPNKPEHFFTENISKEKLDAFCDQYDEYIAMVDAEFGRLVQQLESQGILENTYLILTSDHGQLIERGIHGHSGPTLYESVIHTPLVIHAPGQTEGKNVHSLTSIVDLAPTLLHLSNQQPLDGYEGSVLPTLGGKEDEKRIIFSMHARQNAKMKPLTRVTLSAIQGQYKLIYYKGYPEYEDVEELYDLENDTEELSNIAKEKPLIAAMLKEELAKQQAKVEKNALVVR